METKLTPEEETVLREVIRGQRPPHDLQEIGICVTVESARCQVDNPRHLSFKASLEDLAHGLLAKRNDRRALAEWAWFVQATPSVYDLDIEGDARGEAILEAIWDVSFGKEADRNVFELAGKIAGRER